MAPAALRLEFFCVRLCWFCLMEQIHVAKHVDYTNYKVICIQRSLYAYGCYINGSCFGGVTNFLCACDFKVKEVFAMLKSVVAWRKEFNIESLLTEDLGCGQEKVVYMHGFDKEGHPVCYTAYWEYQNTELYNETFSSEEKRTMFLRWRISFWRKVLGSWILVLMINPMYTYPTRMRRRHSKLLAARTFLLDPSTYVR
ncbi:cellular retinaldehyde binding/alpha-tocopherol transport [Artemisia annua]|uniref:Cellular retinaldehyde binding/alpha-tocopherol transport n=1 Tax=Artemisia annua TaxID=35608 RepID=A0A2U1NSG2_ARTAN|nr:cellular retinaldehyde binding/alpha-tocopherol transport [Artemisia annua]